VLPAPGARAAARGVARIERRARDGHASRQRPLWHVSPCVQALRSSHTVPLRTPTREVTAAATLMASYCASSPSIAQPTASSAQIAQEFFIFPLFRAALDEQRRVAIEGRDSRRAIRSRNCAANQQKDAIDDGSRDHGQEQ
jgi:hypothetical protein